MLPITKTGRKTIFRGSLYAAIAMLTYAQGNLKEGMTPFMWTMFFIGMVLNGLTILRAFIDQTPSREQWEMAERRKAELAAPSEQV